MFDSHWHENMSEIMMSIRKSSGESSENRILAKLVGSSRIYSGLKAPRSLSEEWLAISKKFNSRTGQAKTKNQIMKKWHALSAKHKKKLSASMDIDGASLPPTSSDVVYHPMRDPAVKNSSSFDSDAPIVVRLDPSPSDEDHDYLSNVDPLARHASKHLVL